MPKITSICRLRRPFAPRWDMDAENDIHLPKTTYESPAAGSGGRLAANEPRQPVFCPAPALRIAQIRSKTAFIRFRTENGRFLAAAGLKTWSDVCLCGRVKGRIFKAKRVLDRNWIAKHTQNHETGWALKLVTDLLFKNFFRLCISR